MTANKVTHIINCAGSQVPNHWIPLGVKYLALNWQDNSQQTVQDSVVNECCSFIELALAQAESVLVHSVRGQNRACVIITIFLMRRYSLKRRGRYRWTLMKALEFLNYRRPDLEIRPWFVQQLAGYELRLTKSGAGPKTSTWAGTLLASCLDVFDQSPGPENEEVTLRNTYINALLLPNLMCGKQAKQKKGRGIQWADKVEQRKELATVIATNPTAKEPAAEQPKSIIQEVARTAVEVNKEEAPMARNEVRQRKVVKKEKRNLVEKKCKDEILEIVDMSAKCAGETGKKNAGIGHIINNNVNSIIIQNPQNVEVNTFISRTVDEKKYPKAKKVGVQITD